MHVGALNTVELEFYEVVKVREAFKNYVDHLSAPMPPAEQHPRFFEQRTDFFSELLFQMGKSLEFNFDKRDLDRLSYVPIGWDADQTLQRRNTHLLSQLLAGERPLNISHFLSSNSP